MDLRCNLGCMRKKILKYTLLSLLLIHVFNDSCLFSMDNIHLFTIESSTKFHFKLIGEDSIYPLVGDDHEYVFYTIQIGTYSKINYTLNEKKGIEPDFIIKNKDVGGLYNHMKGFYESKEAAENALSKIQEKEPRAYVAAIAFGERITRERAEKLLRGNSFLLNIEESKRQILK